MKSPFECLLLSKDPELVRRVRGFVAALAEIRVLDELALLERAAEGRTPQVWLVDLRVAGIRDSLPDLLRQPARPVVIALAEPGSDPAREAEGLGLFGIEELEPDRKRFKQLVARALERLRLEQEILMLREDRLRPAAGREPAAPAAGRETIPAHPFLRALKSLDNPAALFEGITEGIARGVGVARVGLFTQARATAGYRLRAERNCLDEIHDLQFGERDPLVQWLARRAHLVCATSLEYLDDPRERLLLNRALDLMGAEVIAPLFARGRLRGWFFIGKRATGQPYAPADLDALAELADQVSITIENALLYEEIVLQKSLAETLLHSIPTGIVAAGEEGILHWFNHAAEDMLGVSARDLLGQPVERAGSVLADLLRRGLAGEAPDTPQEWKDLLTGRHLAARVRPLSDGHRCLGTVVLIENVTARRRLKEKEEQVERTAFWTELAAALSHEVRNPLVAIKTFAQLLPERYADPDFRQEFSQQVTAEADRLNALIEQMDRFAHPSESPPALVDFGSMLRHALDLAGARQPPGAVRVEASIQGALPPVKGDERALSEAVAHLITNALEALAGRSPARLQVTAQACEEADGWRGVRVEVLDDGPGIPPDLRDKVFSPFCTTKPRGLGLGLPIVKRTALSHGGRVEIRTGSGGTLVALYLPAAPAAT